MRTAALVAAIVLASFDSGASASARAVAQDKQGGSGFDPGLFRELQWRNIGPHRASRTKALDGVPGQPHTFYIGVVWKAASAAVQSAIVEWEKMKAGLR